MPTKIDRTKLVKDTLNKYKLTPYIDKAIAENPDFEWRFDFTPKKGDQGFHPSSDCLPNPLVLYNNIVMPEAVDPIGAPLRKTFAVGHFWHAYLQHICVELLGFCDWSEIEAKGTRVWGWGTDGSSPKPYHYCNGMADIASCEIPRHGDWLVDFKTMNTVDFRTPGLPARFAAKYIAQANIYMDMFDKEKALIVKIAKDSPHDLAEVEVYRHQPLIDAIFTKWEVTGFHITEQFPPSEDLIFELPFADIIT